MNGDDVLLETTFVRAVTTNTIDFFIPTDAELTISEVV